MQQDDGSIIIPIPMGSGGSIPMPQRNDRAELIDKIAPDKIVEVFRERLLGRQFLKGEWVDVPALRDKKLTEIGAWELSNLMLGVSSINISLSKLKDFEIKRRLLNIAKTAQIMLVANWKEYGLKNSAQQYYVHEILFSNTLAVLKQADNASIQDLLKQTIQENRNINTEPKKEGRLRRMIFGGGN